MKKLCSRVLLCWVLCGVQMYLTPLFAIEVDVVLPESYKLEKNKRYPTLFVLDGDLNCDLVTTMVKQISKSGGAPEHISVCLTSDDRLRDFAPTVNRDPRGPLGAGGGGDQFLDYIEHTLLPRMQKNYRTNNLRTLLGHSVAGLLVIHAFHSRPALFQAYLAFSPAVWWGDTETATAAMSYVKSGAANSYLYMNIGNESGEMREVYDNFSRTVARNRNVDLTVQLDTFSDAGHNLTLPAGLYNALAGLSQWLKQNQ